MVELLHVPNLRVKVLATLVVLDVGLGYFLYRHILVSSGVDGAINLRRGQTVFKLKYH